MVNTKVCDCCCEEKETTDFPHQEKLGGPGPWCLTCWERYRKSAGSVREGLLAEWKRDYMKAYMRNRRKGSMQRVSYQIVKEENSFRLLAVVGEKVVVVRLVGAWDDGILLGEIAQIIFGVDPIDSVLTGRGGGSGSRKQKIAMVRVEMTLEAWDDGLTELATEWTILEE